LRADVTSRDELGQLAETINRMLTQIENRDSMMEKRVNQRTMELQKLAEDFRYRALHDSLTGLPNRAFLNEEFHRAVAHAKRVGKNFAVLMLDLDNFKYINDTCGHQAGDELLKIVANKLKGALRGGDIVCRLGGDEFIALLEGVQDEEHIQLVADGCLFEAFREEINIADRHFDIGVSIGASLYPQHGEDLTELKRNADIAMYRAKTAGKNRIEVYNPFLDRHMFNTKTLQVGLVNAVANNELFLVFQPQVNSESHTLVGCEAFVRWQHPQYGLMLPEDFLAFAEDNYLIKKIDYFVIYEACRQCQEWLQIHKIAIPIAVNVSSFHFRSSELIEKLESILFATQLPPEMLTLEFSESSLVNKSSMVDSVVESIRALGVKVALDSFVGYCSLSHLGLVNIDYIKLNQSLFRSIVNEKSEQRLLKGLLAFGRELNVTLIAEGIEEYEQIPIFQQLGCPIVQGYVYSKPVSSDVFLHWFDQFQLNKPLFISEATDDELESDFII
jgi:diguanylate cyclase (GGDEF)-like protein